MTGVQRRPLVAGNWKSNGNLAANDELLREIWGFPDEPATRAVDYAIRRLRRKLESDPHNPRHIHTVHGNGYSLTLGQAR